MRSDEAAAYFISKGQTSNLGIAQMMSNSSELDMDSLQRAGIRRTLGFDFGIKIDQSTPYVLVHSNEKPYTHTKAKMFEGDVSENNLLTNEKALDRVFKAIDRLKAKYDKLKALEADIIDTEED